MNSSYKIALLAAFAVLAIVVAYYVFFSSDPTPATNGPDATIADNNTPDDTGNGDTNRLPPVRVTPPIRETPPDRPEIGPGPAPGPEIGPGNEITIGPGPGPGETPADPDLDPEGGESEPTETPIVIGPTPRPVIEDPIVEPEVEIGDDIEPGPGPIVEEPDQPEPVRPEPRPVTPPRTYTVQPGDTLSSIAEEIYDDPNAWVDIAQANGSIDPTRLQPGQVLILPDRAAVAVPDPEPAPVAPGQEQTYVIQAGDNLSRIAQRFYSDPDAWQVIYNRNRDRIGTSPNNLKVGMRIIIPPRYDGAN